MRRTITRVSLTPMDAPDRVHPEALLPEDHAIGTSYLEFRPKVSARTECAGRCVHKPAFGHRNCSSQPESGRRSRWAAHLVCETTSIYLCRDDQKPTTRSAMLSDRAGDASLVSAS